MQEHNDNNLKFLLYLSSPCIVACVGLVYWHLLQIEINKTLYYPSGLESVGSHEDVQRAKTKPMEGSGPMGSSLGLEEEPSPAAVTRPEADADGETPRRFKITKLRNIALVFTTLALSLLTYLLLVASNASIWLSLLGVVAVIGVGLWQQICEELRRQRLDRIAAIVTLLFLTAAFLSLAVYANQSLKEGEIYQGNARIIGFDYDSYDNSNRQGG